jgi:hypothetical protein
VNLGVIYLKTALAILASGLVLGAIITGVFLSLRRKRVLVSTMLFGALVIGMPAGFFGLIAFHQPLFRIWHRLQNEAVPTTGCVTYEPSFWQFHATYEMDRPSFDRWVASHPWGLKPCKPDTIFQFADGPYFGLTSCEAVYESPRGPKGNNLRVYYQDGMAYLSYSVM